MPGRTCTVVQVPCCFHPPITNSSFQRHRCTGTCYMHRVHFSPQLATPMLAMLLQSLLRVNAWRCGKVAAGTTKQGENHLPSPVDIPYIRPRPRPPPPHPLAPLPRRLALHVAIRTEEERQITYQQVNTIPWKNTKMQQGFGGSVKDVQNGNGETDLR